MKFVRLIGSRISPLSVLWISIVLFTVFFSYLSFARHDNFHSRRLDLGNMEQTVWNLVNGNGFTLTDPMGEAQISRLAVHADFLLLFMVPFYLFWSDPKVLLLVQTVVVAIGALPVYWIARKELKSEKLALLFSVIYLLYPALQHILLHDFHSVTLSTTLLLFSYWYMVRKKYFRFVLFILLAALGKETTWLVMAWMGLYVGVALGNRRAGFSLAVLGFGMFVVLYWYVMPSLSVTGRHFALSYLSEFGSSQTDIIGGLINNPLKVLSMAFLPDRLEWYYRMVQPLGFLPLLSPFPLVFAIHSIVINIVSSNGMMRMIDYQYNAEIIPFLFVAAILGFRNLSVFIKRHRDVWNVRRMRHIVLGGLVGFVLLSSVGWGELPLTMEDRFYYFIWPLPEAPIMRQVVRSIDPVYTVSVTNNIGAHVSGRKFLYNFPIMAKQTDYTLVLLGDTYAWPSGDEQKRMVGEMLKSQQHELIAHTGEFYAFRKK